MAKAEPAILWLRNDLRLADNPALVAAAATGRPVLPLYVLDDETPGRWRTGGASRWWLHQSLASLATDFRRRHGDLLLRRGEAGSIIRRLVEETGARHVFWNRRYEPWAIAQDRELKAALREAGVAVESFNAALCFEPWEIAQKGGGPYKVYTPYARAWFDRDGPPEPVAVPEPLYFLRSLPDGDALDDWRLTPKKPDWAGGLRAAWRPGEAAALEAATEFADGPVEAYDTERNFPARPGVSRLSPHLHFGEIGGRQLFHLVRGRTLARRGSWQKARPYLRQLAWRDFAYHTLFHRPTLPEEPLRPEFAAFPWSDEERLFRAWTRGLTGYPIVDAGMRQLWATGYMHNRVRMIAGSFLTKDLLIPWQKGEAWFWDTLVDADLANNAMGWQWVAGCGIDAAPYFRIFNPVLQGERFDPDGSYVRRWVPELSSLPDRWIHMPFAAPADVLSEAGVVLGKSYPEALVDHGKARDRALEAYRGLQAEAG